MEDNEKQLRDDIRFWAQHETNGVIEQLQNIIDFLKDKDGSLLPIQNLQEAIENIKKM